MSNIVIKEEENNKVHAHHTHHEQYELLERQIKNLREEQQRLRACKAFKTKNDMLVSTNFNKLSPREIGEDYEDDKVDYYRESKQVRGAYYFHHHTADVLVTLLDVCEKIKSFLGKRKNPE